MHIAITTEGPSLDTMVDQRFGRCPFFLIVNTDDLSFEAIKNANAALSGGAGIQSARMIVEKKVTHVLTGACGPNAYRVLEAAGVEVITNCTGDVRDVIRQFREGKYTTTGGPNVADHYGVRGSVSEKAIPVMDDSGGFTPGMGRGMGRGMGGGLSVNDQQLASTGNRKMTDEEELETLKLQMKQINDRIRQLEKNK